MSYYQGTQLYYHGTTSSYATVVTNGNVMITSGLGAGTIIKLADWLILSGGAEIHEAVTTFPPAELNNVAKPLAKVVTSLECGCRSDGLYCNTHLYE